MNDVNTMKKSVNIVDVIGRRVALTKKGGEWRGLCPFHNDQSASLMVNEKKQVWGCFACGGDGGHNVNEKFRSSGDVIDFLLRFGLTWPEVRTELSGKLIDTNGPTQNKAKAKQSKPVTWTPIVSPSAPGQIVHWQHGKPSRFWLYRTADGKVLSAVCRFDLAGGGKEVLPLTYCVSDGGAKEWRWQAIATNRPLYNLKGIKENPKATILVVEGEKTADAAQKLLPHVVVTCWQGGANGLGKTDWSPLKGRRVMLWPDNDKFQKYGEKHPKAGKVKPFHEQPGNAAMMAIAELLKPDAKVVKWIKNAPDFPDKWDVADAVDWTPEIARKYAQDNLVDVPEIQPDDEPQEQEPPPPHEPVYDLPGPQTDEQVVDFPPQESAHDAKAKSRSTSYVSDFSTYFAFLGFQKDFDQVTHVFFIRETRTVVKYPSGRLARLSTLIQIAPLDFWEASFTPKRGAKVNVDMALNWLCRVSHEQGFFTGSRLRGRGAWLDDERVVVHCGDRLIVNGKETDLGKLNSRFVYEAGPELGIFPTKPLNVQEANRLMEIFNMMNFERDADAFLLAGWCIVAPVCGALKWRPHLWVTGGAGTGKSWVLLNVVRVLLGKTALAVQSETSEAGLRQLLQSDALPVVFDEAEGEDERSQRRMQTVLTLMRAASADDGGLMVKGSAGGAAQKYQIRSCFAFASIGISASQQSDRSRITIVSLKAGRNSEEERAQRWKTLQEKHLEILTQDFVERLQARTISLLPVIIQNAKIFGAAAAAELGEQRAGDQVGALLAGAYSLFSNNVVEYQAAVEWVKNKNWDEEKSLDESKDETRLLHYLLEHLVKVDTGKGAKEAALGELIGIALNNIVDDPAIMTESAAKRLSQMGVAIKETHVYFSNTSSVLRGLLRGTAWGINHHKILIRIDGAVASDSIYFASGIASRAVGIPLTMFGKHAQPHPTNELPKINTGPPNEEEDLPF